MNTGSFAGYLGRDAVLRSTTSGKPVANFSLAVSVGHGGKRKTLWVACALWGEKASVLLPFLTKGAALAVVGDIDLRTFETRNGKTSTHLILDVLRLTLLGGKQCDEGAPPDFSDDIPL